MLFATLKKSTLAACVGLCLAGASWAQTGPVKLIVGFPPGGSADALARAVTDKLSAALGVPVVVETKAGAGGRIAAELLKNAPADGNTVMIAPMAPMLIAPLTFSKLPYNADTDFVPVAQLAKFQLMIATAGNGPYKTLGDLVGAFKADPKKANFGTSATGSQLHFLGVMLGQAIGVDMVHVAYQGGGPLKNDVMGGQIAAGIDTLEIELHKAGKLRMLATSGATRSPLAPDVPTFKEQGYPGVVGEGWFGAYLPAKTPDAMVQRLSEALAAVVRQPDVKAKIEAAGLEATGLKQAEFATVIAADKARWTPVVAFSKFKAD
jgi:tripartite-type tricarboxylate transporter receptor subunit TctC